MSGAGAEESAGGGEGGRGPRRTEMDSPSIGRIDTATWHESLRRQTSDADVVGRTSVFRTVWRHGSMGMVP